MASEATAASTSDTPSGTGTNQHIVGADFGDWRLGEPQGLAQAMQDHRFHGRVSACGERIVYATSADGKPGSAPMQAGPWRQAPGVQVAVAPGRHGIGLGPQAVAARARCTLGGGVAQALFQRLLVRMLSVMPC